MVGKNKRFRINLNNYLLGVLEKEFKEKVIEGII